jgi:hypothetical protein
MKSFGTLLNKAVRNPVEGVIGIFSFGLLFYAVYLVSPWYHAGYNVATAGLQRNAEYVFGAFMILTAIPGLIAPFVNEFKRGRLLYTATTGVFLSFLFLTILRILLFGFIPFTWLPIIMISLASAYLNVWLKVRKE